VLQVVGCRKRQTQHAQGKEVDNPGAANEDPGRPSKGFGPARRTDGLALRTGTDGCVARGVGYGAYDFHNGPPNRSGETTNTHYPSIFVISRNGPLEVRRRMLRPFGAALMR
jgi:hypothetical protein